jgi:hypothetical protein
VRTLGTRTLSDCVALIVPCGLSRHQIELHGPLGP